MANRSSDQAVLTDRNVGELRLVDSGEMMVIERAASERFGIPSPIMMENAGIKALHAIQQEIWKQPLPAEPVTVVAGRGNNGGDALVIARQLHAEGARDLMVLLSHGNPTAGSQCAANLAICYALGIEVSTEPPAGIAQNGWVIDGMTGTGLRGALTGRPAALAKRINRSAARVIALDTPSGVGDRFVAGMPAMSAEWTLALELPKRSLYLPAARVACGSIIVVPIGFPKPLTDMGGAEARLLGPAALNSSLPAVRADAHKGMRGHVAVIGGSVGTAGAARLAATAAASSRAGLVTLHADADTYSIQAAALTSVMVVPWSEAADPAVLTEKFDSLVVGPGWGTGPDRAAWLRNLLELPVCGVLDADAITLLDASHGRPRPCAGRWVLTPHPGELARALETTPANVLADPIGAANELAMRLGTVVVLKGHVTYVVVPEGHAAEGDALTPRLSVIDGMQPWLATGGSGDVLAGVIGGLLAGGELTPYQAACSGVLIHAAAARRAYGNRGWFLSEDLPEWVSRVMDRQEDSDNCS